MPGPATAPPANGMRHGPSNAVPCPHCGAPQDCRPLQEQRLLEAGHDMICDHCNRFMTILRVQPVVMVSVRQSKENRGVAPREGGAAGAAPARTISQAALARLTGRR